MRQFSYKAKDKAGGTVAGVVEGANEAIAARTLQEHGLLVVSLSEKKSLSLVNFKFKSEGASGRDVATFTRLLATMLKAGLPLVDALTDLTAQIKNAYFKDVIRSILHDVQGGGSLSGSMQRYPKVFSTLYVSLVKAGEASGKVDEGMERLADMLEADLEFKGKVKGALLYPAIVVVVMSGVGVFMVTTIIPKIADVYKEFGAELPLPTRILVGLADFLKHDTIIALGLIVLVYFGFKMMRKNPVTDYMINNALLHFPVMGELQVEVIFTIVNRTLGTLVASGVSILDALKIVVQTVGNNYIRMGLETAAKSVEKGLPLSIALSRNPDFPIIMSQLVGVGEETGTLDQSLQRVAAYYQESSERKIKNLTTALEPLMILLMGMMVGGLAVAVLLPMFNLVNVIH